jgi:5'-deoxynucleotidase YfbR-like HD superfamily hydrolase
MSLVKEAVNNYRSGRIEKGATRRKVELSKVWRFGEHPGMVHRNNLERHAERVSLISQALGVFLMGRGVPVNLDTLDRLAQRHDDPEVITGDVSKRRKLDMSPKEKRRLKRKENRANKREMVRYFGIAPSQERRQYRNDYKQVSAKETIEARIIDIADKIEGICETIHDIRSGNDGLDGVLTRYRDEVFATLQPDLIKSHFSTEPLNLTVDAIPTAEEAQALPKIDRQIVDSDQFREKLFDDRLPGFYRLWLDLSDIKFGKSGVFPGWSNDGTVANRRSIKETVAA